MTDIKKDPNEITLSELEDVSNGTAIKNMMNLATDLVDRDDIKTEDICEQFNSLFEKILTGRLGPKGDLSIELDGKTVLGPYTPRRPGLRWKTPEDRVNSLNHLATCCEMGTGANARPILTITERHPDYLINSTWEFELVQFRYPGIEWALHSVTFHK